MDHVVDVVERIKNSKYFLQKAPLISNEYIALYEALQEALQHDCFARPLHLHVAPNARAFFHRGPLAEAAKNLGCDFLISDSDFYPLAMLDYSDGKKDPRFDPLKEILCTKARLTLLRIPEKWTPELLQSLLEDVPALTRQSISAA